jgi:hypothetical protein
VTRKGATKVAEAAPVAPAGMTMRRAPSDMALHGAVLLGDSWFAWRVMLIALMGEALTDAERVLFNVAHGTGYGAAGTLRRILGHRGVEAVRAAPSPR